MKKTASILLAGMLIATIAGIGIVSAAVDETDDTALFGQMHRWAANRMGYGYDNCPVYGAYASDGITVAELEVGNIDEAIKLAENATCPVYGAYASDGITVAELEVGNIDEAIKLAENATGEEITESNVYQMGRWWVFSYADDEGTITQGRIDAYTGEVIDDFYANQRPQYQSGRSMRGSGYAGCGGAGYRY
ncbi:MAG: hypothetical protein RBT65_09125 [Methanolobus sp.]|nr:hypothetical protein [Methanolobus sp.]